MFKKTMSWILVCALLLTLLPAAVLAVESGNTGTYYSYADIVKRTYDMSQLATVPKAGEGGKQVTSYDRSSVYNEETGLYENWDANADWSGYEGVNPDNGYRILANLEGPGYLTHIMTGQNWSGRLHIWIDGELVIDDSFVDVVWGEYFSEFDQLSFKANYVNMNGFEDGYQGMIDLAVPITYNESCVVEVDCDVRSGFYCTVGYYDLEEGASVEPFTWPMSDANRAALKEANDKLNDTSVPVGDSKYSSTVAPGETVTLYESSTVGAITGTSLEIDIPAEAFDDQTSLVEWQIAIYWDGSDTPAAWMSVADFYGTPHGLDAFDNAGYGVKEDGTMYTTWYMPYNTAEITLTNNSDTARQVDASFATEDLTDAEANELMRFHANWQRAYQRTDDRYPDAQWLYVEGEGRYVGVSHHVYQIVDGIWWGEGDEKFFVDGEKFPTWFGTGSEDYFWYAWCASTIWGKAYAGQPHNIGTPSHGNHQVQGHGDKVNYRVHVLDSVTFTQSFEANIEKYYPEDCVKYADTTYFYLTKETSSNHVPVEQTMEDRLFNNDMLTGATLFYPGAYLISRLIYSNTSVEPWVQGMAGVCEGEHEWFGDSHLFWQPTSTGKYMEFELEIPETDEYAINLSMTNAFDYGQYSFYLDGELIGSADFWGNPVDQTNITLTTKTVTKGEHILKIACTGANSASAGYYLGLNYLEFVSTAEEAPRDPVNLKYSGSSGLLGVLDNYTSSEAPHDQGLDAAISDDGSHLFWRSAIGDEMSFEISVPYSGNYDITVANTCYGDFGMYELYLDGVKIGGPYDTFDTVVTVKQNIAEDVAITAGDHLLTVKCTGKNDSAWGNVLGIDYIELNEDQSSDIEKEIVDVKYTGSAGILKAVDSYTSTEAPHDQGLDTAISDDGSHMFWRPAIGDELSLKINVPSNGEYDITFANTCYGDFGTYEVYLDGEKIGGPFDTFDTVVTVKQFVIEKVEMTGGDHLLTIKCVGKNDSAWGNVLGFDYISLHAEIEKESETVPTVDVKYSGSSGLLGVLDSYTSTEAPHDQGLDPAISDDGSHMFWRPAIGDEAHFNIEVPMTGNYDITVAYTCLGDFGQFELYMDGVRIGTTFDAFSTVLYVQTDVIKDVALTEGKHVLTIKCVGKNDSAWGNVLGIDYISMSAPMVSQGEDEIVDNSGLFETEKKAAKEELAAYAEAAYETADEYQEPKIRRALTAAKVEICQAATVEEINKLLADAKAQIDTILATVYEEELEVDYDPEASMEIYYRGSGDLLGIMDSYTSAETPHDQGLNLAVSDDGSHLFWRSAEGNEVNFKVSISSDGAYDLTVAYTCYNDFGKFELYLDGNKIGDTYDAYDTVITVKQALIEGLNLTAGEHTLTIKCVGKNEKSSGTVLGIDYVRFLGEGSVTELDAYKNAARTYLDSYKQSVDYSADQWNAVLSEIARQKDMIDACGSIDAVVEAWKNAKAALDAVPSGLIEYDTLDFSETLTPGDYGWETDGGNYTNWQVVQENEYFDHVFFVEYNGSNSKRIWKDIIEDPDNFTITFTVKVENWRAEIELMGVHIELNCEHGNGNQIFDRESWSWFDAKNQICEVTITRENGGDLVFTLLGQGNATPVIITKAVVDESNQNLYLGVIDATGSAFFHDIAPAEVDNGEDPGENPVDPENPENPENPEDPEDPENPDTGDTVQMLAALLLASAMSAVTLINKKSLLK